MNKKTKHYTMSNSKSNRKIELTSNQRAFIHKMLTLFEIQRNNDKIKDILPMYRVRFEAIINQGYYNTQLASGYEYISNTLNDQVVLNEVASQYKVHRIQLDRIAKKHLTKL